jgi:GNAT superfamily N-acetyltransferase
MDRAAIAIHRATTEDVGTVLAFRMAMMAEIAEAEAESGPAIEAALRDGNERWIREHMADDFAAWVAEIDGRPAGTAGILWFPHPPSRRSPDGLEAYILNVYTAPEWRNRGVARALMERVVQEARAAGIKRIWLRASAAGRPLYESLGFGERNYLELT